MQLQSPGHRGKEYILLSMKMNLMNLMSFNELITCGKLPQPSHCPVNCHITHFTIIHYKSPKAQTLHSAMAQGESL